MDAQCIDVSLFHEHVLPLSGKSNKGKIENLYYLFAKAAVPSMDNLMSMMSATGDNPEAAADALSAPEMELTSQRAERLGLLQQVLAIKEGKQMVLSIAIVQVSNVL